MTLLPVVEGVVVAGVAVAVGLIDVGFVLVVDTEENDKFKMISDICLHF